jgi:hypothetical protein
MPKPATARALLHVVIASFVYAAALAIVVSATALFLAGEASLGDGVTLVQAGALAAVLCLLSGAFSMAAVLSPLAVFLGRLGLAHYSLIMFIAAVAGCLPLIGLTWGPQGFGQGLESGWSSELIVFFAFAGVCGGLYLWVVWFRHLTGNSSGTR